MKPVYLLSLVVGLVIVIYFYFINFDNMSETELVNSVLYWYVPLIFGLYGLMGIRIKRTIEDGNGAIKHLFSGDDASLTLWTVFVAIISGLVGIFLFFIPLAIFPVKSEAYDSKIALTGALVWLLILFLFFEVAWPAL